MIHRRDFLRYSLALGPAAHLLGAAPPDDPFDRAVAAILGRLRAPHFASRDFRVLAYGAAGDGETDCRPAFAEAIEACHRAGGGRVVVPAGTFLSNGPIHLLSNVNLFLDEGAIIRFGINPRDYLPAVLVRWEGTRCYNYSPLIYAHAQENMAITGRGIIDGQTGAFWQAWLRKQGPDQTALRGMGTKGTALDQRTFGEGHFLRPDLLQMYDCRNILIEGVTFKASPFWTIHPVFCDNITVRGVRVLAGTANDDGCDPESCRDVLIEDCIFDTADDNIAIKAGRDQDAWGGRVCENIIVRRCTGAHSRSNGFCIGSEMSGGVRNVFIEDCQVGDVQSALYVKSNSDRGGFVENVWMRRVHTEVCDNFIKLETDYKNIEDHAYPSQYRNFHFEHLVCDLARQVGIYSVGIASTPISGITLKDVDIKSAENDKRIAFTKDLSMTNVSINGQAVKL